MYSVHKYKTAVRNTAVIGCRKSLFLKQTSKQLQSTTIVGSVKPSNRTSPFFEGGHGCPKLNAQRLCKDAKPTKRSFKGKGDSARREKDVLLKWLWDGKVWCGNPSGSRPNFFGRQHLTFDKGGKDVGMRRRMVRMRNRQSVH